MIAGALTIALGCVSLALVLTLYRLFKGPSAADRILALSRAAACGPHALPGFGWCCEV